MTLPKIIHRVWLGGNEPAKYAEYGHTWGDSHPDYEIRQWNGPDGLSEFGPNQVFYDHPNRHAPIRNHGQFLSDLLRLEILWEFGGIYVDADFECLKPVDDLLDDTSFAAAWEIQDAYLANGFLAAPPGHPFTAFLRDGISESLRRHSRDHRPNRTTGPRYLTPMYRLWTAQGGQSVRTLDQAAFFPYGYDDVGTPRENPPWPESSYAVHHWNNRRRTLGTAP